MRGMSAILEGVDLPRSYPDFKETTIPSHQIILIIQRTTAPTGHYYNDI
jgi:hypothetical protein